MKKIIVRILLSLAAILLSLTVWAYFWPSLTDETELLAPGSFEDFYPSTGSKETWERMFAPQSQHFSHSFEMIRKSVDAEQIGDAVDIEALDLLDAAYALSQADFDIPRFTPEKKSGTDFGKFRDYIKFVTLLPPEENREHYEAALRLSETYMARSKTLVDYMMALSAIGILQDSGFESETYANEWRDALGRAVRSEYYFARESDEIGGRFLFQEAKTWNDMWRYLAFIGECIANDNIEAMNERAESIVTEWMRWPYTNLKGELILAMAFPSIETIYQKSLELEQKIHQGAGINSVTSLRDSTP